MREWCFDRRGKEKNNRLILDITLETGVKKGRSWNGEKKGTGSAFQFFIELYLTFWFSIFKVTVAKCNLLSWSRSEKGR